jgi:hypothetical protein
MWKKLITLEKVIKMGRGDLCGKKIQGTLFGKDDY